MAIFVCPGTRCTVPVPTPVTVTFRPTNTSGIHKSIAAAGNA